MSKSSPKPLEVTHPEKDPLEEYRNDDWAFLRQALSRAKVYLEYGAGTSTEFIATEYSCSIRSIETSQVWFSTIQDRIGKRGQIIHVDLGETGDWGRPLSYEKRHNFIDYFEAGFIGGYNPDAILIDGRFRVACFLTSLIHANPGTHIVFDDYPYRPHYQIIEEVLEPFAVNQRQAIFKRPSEIDLEQLISLRDQFSAVMD